MMRDTPWTDAFASPAVCTATDAVELLALERWYDSPLSVSLSSIDFFAREALGLVVGYDLPDPLMRLWFQPIANEPAWRIAAGLADGTIRRRCVSDALLMETAKNHEAVKRLPPLRESEESRVSAMIALVMAG